jgi:hypothetical protein
MKAVCDSVLERLALGEPLAELAEHVAACPRCARAVALPGLIARTHNQADAGLGFAARMTAGAQQRLASRRRQRVAITLATSVAVAAAAALVLTRPAADPVVDRPALEVPAPERDDHDDRDDRAGDPTPIVIPDDELQQLVDLADTRRARQVSAPWGRIERPLAPYRKLVLGTSRSGKGVTP